MNAMTQQPQPVAIPLKLPHLTRNEAQARSMLAQRARDCAVPLGGQAWSLTLEPLQAGAATAFGTGDWLVRGDWAGAPFELRLPERACEQWVRARFADVDPPTLPPAMRAAVLEAALGEALAALRALQRGPARLEPAQGGDLSAALPQRFGLMLVQGEQVVHGLLATNGLGLMLMAGLVAQRPNARGPVDEDALPLLLRAEVGTATLRADELASLAIGDAVLLAHSWITQDGQLWLGQDEWGVRVRWEDTRLVVTEAFNRTGLTMATEQDAPAAGDNAIALDSLPVRLHFDLGERRLTLGEVKALQVGQSLELARPLAQAVSIRANGALIGTGELVEIDGRLAVTVTALG
jgi:type III secretion protein Q